MCGSSPFGARPHAGDHRATEDPWRRRAAGRGELSARLPRAALPRWLWARRGSANSRGRRFSAVDHRPAFASRVEDAATGADDLAQLGVGVAVAVGVFEDDEPAQPARVADRLDHAVVDGDDRRPWWEKMLIPRRVGEEEITSAALPGMRAPAVARLSDCAGGDFVGVAGVGGDREVGALGEPGQRADQVRRAACRRRARRRAPPARTSRRGCRRGSPCRCRCRAAGGVQVVGRGADRVDRVVGVLAAVAVGVDTVGFPGRGQELHPADRAGAGDVEVGAEVGLDLVDRGEHLPGDPVLGPAGLVDRQQEGRDLERVDDEVGDADRGRPEAGDRRRRVGGGGGAAAVELRAAAGALRAGLVAAAGGAGEADAAVGAVAPAPADALVVGDAPLCGPWCCCRRSSRRRGSRRRSRRRRLRWRARRRCCRGPGPVRAPRCCPSGRCSWGRPCRPARRRRRRRRSSRPGPGPTGSGWSSATVAGGAFAARQRVGPRHADAERGHDREAGQRDGQCELVSHPLAPRCPLQWIAQPVSALSPRNRLDQATCSPGGTQRPAPPPNKALIKVVFIRQGGRISAGPDVLVKLVSMSAERSSVDDDEQDGLRARSEQAIGELAQALLDNPTLHNALSAAFGAREKALEAQQAAMSALNLPSAGDVERLERRLRSLLPAAGGGRGADRRASRATSPRSAAGRPDKAKTNPRL